MPNFLEMLFLVPGSPLIFYYTIPLVGFNFYLSDNALLLWRIDSLLGKHLETENETTAIAMQQRGVHASAKIELLVETMFSMLSVPRS
jgi:hypothetical protein